jgi:5-methylcytosine-specific restriction endonuclease McrA
MSRDKNYIKMINSTKWRELRLKKLQSQPLCEKCLEADKTTAACEVHHIIPVESAHNETQMKGLMFDMNNLMSLCHTCHADIHKAMFSHTKENVKANRQRQTKRFIEKYL